MRHFHHRFPAILLVTIVLTSPATAAESRAQLKQRVVVLLDEGRRLSEDFANLTDVEVKRVERVFPAAVNLAKRSGDDKLIAEALRTTTRVYVSSLRDHFGLENPAPEFAKELYEVDTRRKAPKRLIAEDLEALGWSLYHVKRKDWQEQAPQYAERALELAKEIGDKPRVARCWAQLGIFYAYMGDLVRSAQSWDSAASVYTELGNKWRVAQAKASVGQLRFDLGEHERGLKALFEALDSAETIHPRLTPGEQYGNQMTMNECWGGLGDFYFRYAQYPKALEYFRRAAEGMERVGFGPSAIMRARAAECYAAMDKAEEAERQYAEIFANEGFGSIKENVE